MHLGGFQHHLGGLVLSSQGRGGVRGREEDSSPLLLLWVIWNVPPPDIPGTLPGFTQILLGYHLPDRPPLNTTSAHMLHPHHSLSHDSTLLPLGTAKTICSLVCPCLPFQNLRDFRAGQHIPSTSSPWHRVDAFYKYVNRRNEVSLLGTEPPIVLWRTSILHSLLTSYE